jgi:menaquinone-dependent protoporphyrinogen oxidase
MKPVLVLYATRQGQARRVAEYVVSKLTFLGVAPELIDAGKAPQGLSLARYSAVVVCASVHLGKHEREMTRFVKRHAAELAQIPSAFLSISLSEAGAENSATPPRKRALAEANVREMIETFLAKTGWRPMLIRAVAGALAYRKYNFAVRSMMKRVALQAGAPTDTSQNHEFTDWAALDAFVDELLQAALPELSIPQDMRQATVVS